MNNKSVITEFKFPAGKYFIGDPCYVLEDDIYDKVTENFDFDKSYTIEINGHTIFMHGTAYGDGSYKDGSNRSYSVDSGLISIMPMELISMKKFNETQFQEFRESYTHMIEFDKEFNVFYEDGKFIFGTIEINTSGCDDEEEDDYYEDESSEDL